ncbi:MAG: 30S ribosomal protein S20 [Atribacterota bacterium]
MPIIKSAIKRVKISEKQHQRNSTYKSKVRTLIKKYENSLVNENLEDANQYYHQCVSILDKAAQKGILEKNTVSRKKSLLSKKLLHLSKKKQTQNSQTDVEKK